MQNPYKKGREIKKKKRRKGGTFRENVMSRKTGSRILRRRGPEQRLYRRKGLWSPARGCGLVEVGSERLWRERKEVGRVSPHEGSLHLLGHFVVAANFL